MVYLYYIGVLLFRVGVMISLFKEPQKNYSITYTQKL
jgi:hypothetical protein